jgi:hypothetical protein
MQTRPAGFSLIIMTNAKSSESKTDRVEPTPAGPTGAPLDAPPADQKRRLGALQGQFTVPDDFDRLGSAEIERLFHGEEAPDP